MPELAGETFRGEKARQDRAKAGQLAYR